MIYKLLNLLDTVRPIARVSAHCDIPCKIYDPATAQIAALTVVRMVDLITEQVGENGAEGLAAQAQLTRLVAQKETHVQQIKNDIRVIWGDYLKQPQFEEFPETHELVHGIMLAASKCAQNIDRAAAEALLEKVNAFAKIFWATKGINTFTANCPYPPALPVVYPKLD